MHLSGLSFYPVVKLPIFAGKFYQLHSMTRILIIRFSSIGDIIQCMSVVGGLKQQFPDAELHWVTRKDMSSLLRIDPRIDKIWEFDRKDSIVKLIGLAIQLRKLGFTHVYDAHSNIRSNLFKLIFCPFGICRLTQRINLVTRHKDRFKRLLLFKFGVNLLPKPFRSFESFQRPLVKWEVTRFDQHFTGWHFPEHVVSRVDALMGEYLQESNLVTLVPSAAWELKRWPVNYWQQLVKLLPQCKFVILGGPGDLFCEEIRETAPERVINLAGKTSLLESFCVVYQSRFVVSGDTGFLHAADLFDKPGAALIGPTAFGFPTGQQMKVMEVDLPCRPCTKDGNVKCKLKEVKKCMMDITPDLVAREVVKWMNQ
jgi:heptosyltransferase-2